MSAATVATKTDLKSEKAEKTEKFNSLPECPVCREHYDFLDHSPRIFQCGHTCCTNCIKQINMINKQWLCVMCRQITHVPQTATNSSHPAELLPKNFSLLEMIEKQTVKETKKEKEIEKEFTYEICQKHKEKRLYYCHECKVFLCAFCLETETTEHKSHKYELFSSISKKANQSLMKIIKEATQQTVELKKINEKHTESLKEIKKKTEEEQKKFDVIYQNIIATLESLRNNMRKFAESAIVTANNRVEESNLSLLVLHHTVQEANSFCSSHNLSSSTDYLSKTNQHSQAIEEAISIAQISKKDNLPIKTELTCPDNVNQFLDSFSYTVTGGIYPPGADIDCFDGSKWRTSRIIEHDMHRRRLKVCFKDNKEEEWINCEHDSFANANSRAQFSQSTVKIGDMVECLDKFFNPPSWLPAQIIGIDQKKALFQVHYIEYTSRFDEYVEVSRIRRPVVNVD